MQADTITLTHAELAALIGQAVASAIAAKSGPMTPAEKQRAYRERKASVTEKVTASGKSVTDVTEKVTQTPRSLAPSPLPLASPSPRPHTHTPAPTPTHEAGQVKASKPKQAELLAPAEEKPESVMLDASLSADLHQAWQEWQTYRQRRAAAKGKDRLAWTCQAARMGAMQVASYSQSHGPRIVCDRIASAIGGNWQGLNLDKMDRPKSSPHSQNGNDRTTTRPPVTRNAAPLPSNQPSLDDSGNRGREVSGLPSTGRPCVGADGEIEW